MSPNVDVSALLHRYQDLGFRLVYWERKGSDPDEWKGPQGREAKGWNAPEKEYPLDQYDPTHMNLGLFTGHEVAPGRFLADVDFDWSEGLIFAPHLIPTTGFAFGRKGKKVSHALFTTPERLGVTSYYDISDDAKGDGNGDTFVELRGGNSTHQTMIAPSLRKPDTPIELVLNGELMHVPTKTLQDAVIDYAIACLLLKRTGGGFHHDGRVALAGYLMRLGFSDERTQRLGEELCRAQVLRGVRDMSDKDITDMAFVVRTTRQKLNANKKVAGGPKLAAFLGTIGNAVVARIAKYCGVQDDFIRNAQGIIVPKNHHNIKHALTLLGHDLSYNEFADSLLIDGKKMEDREVNNVLTNIEIEFRFQPPEQYFERVVKFLAWSNPFHPVKDYLTTLQWDNVRRIDEWLITSGGVEDTPYARAVSSIMLIAAVRRIRQPGCKYDEMVVWESQQGTNKSSAAQALCPNPSWFSDDLRLNLHAQQLIEATLGKWIIEASDLAGKRKTEIEQLKAMMSRQVDGPARMAYAHFAVERPRHFIIVGTTNSSAYLTDSTGARRFWPLVVRRFDIEWIREHRDQLWAEACVREATGESIRLAEELWPDAAKHQETRREIDPWEGTLRKYLLSVDPSGDKRRRVATSMLWEEALHIPLERRDRPAAMRISEIMQRLGFKRTTVRAEDTVQAGYVTEDEHKLRLSEDSGVDEPEDDTPF
jgi:predicted P-loop ATPase